MKINIVDTPGHADFGGEVERVLKMVDSVLLLVDAFDGPMPQTRFVLKKSLDLGIKPDRGHQQDRPPRRPPGMRSSTMVFDLFCELNANEKQLDFPVVYTSAKQGYAKRTLEESGDRYAAALRHDSRAGGAAGGRPARLRSRCWSPASTTTTTSAASPPARSSPASVKAGETVALVQRDGTINKGRISKLLGYEGLKQVEIEEAIAGDIVTIAGFDDVGIGETFAAADQPGGDPLRLPSTSRPFR